MKHARSLSNNNRLAIALAVVITTAWAISFIVDIIVQEYDPSASVHALMMIVAGAVFGEGLISSRNGSSNTDRTSANEQKGDT